MATLRILSYETIGSNSKHESSSWQIALDPKFKYIIDESIEDTVNLTSWTTPLPKRPEHKEFGDDVLEFYTDEVALYARVRLRIGNVSTSWLDVPVKTQLYQEYDVTENGNETYTSNSIDLGMVTKEDLVPPEWEYPEEDLELDEVVLVKYCFDCRMSVLMEDRKCKHCGGTEFTKTQDSLEILPPPPEEETSKPITPDFGTGESSGTDTPNTEDGLVEDDLLEDDLTLEDNAEEDLDYKN